MNSKIIFSVVITFMLCIIAFLLYERNRNEKNATEYYIPQQNIEQQLPQNLQSVQQGNQGDPPTNPNQQEAPQYNQNTPEENQNPQQTEQQQTTSAQQSGHQHQWIYCPKCSGKGAGFFGDEMVYGPCPRCMGYKQICKTCFERRPLEYAAADPNCRDCSGSGKCLYCNGTGRTYNEDFEYTGCEKCGGTKKCACCRKVIEKAPDEAS